MNYMCDQICQYEWPPSWCDSLAPTNENKRLGDNLIYRPQSLRNLLAAFSTFIWQENVITMLYTKVNT